MIEHINPFKKGGGHNNPFQCDGEREVDGSWERPSPKAQGKTRVTLIYKGRGKPILPDESECPQQPKGASMSATSNDALKSKSQLLVELLMAKMNNKTQSIPTRPTVPSDDVCRLRASLMLEEVLETIHALGVDVTVGSYADGSQKSVDIKSLSFHNVAKPDLIEIADGLGDLDVVGPCGTASACGIAMEPIKYAIDANNLLKFAPGHKFREDGKLIKPANHPDVHDEICRLLIEQGADVSLMLQEKP